MPVHATAMLHRVPEGAPCPRPGEVNVEQRCPEKEPKRLPLRSPPCKVAAAEPDLAPALAQQ